jgi:nicotinamidase-related amidase
LKLAADRSFLLLVDFQRPFLDVIDRGESALTRAKFLARCANALSIPVCATEQNPTKLGALDAELGGYCQVVNPKMAFSGYGSQPILAGQVIVAGVETHICVSQTVRDLRVAGHEVVVAGDAVAARSPEMHAMGISRIRDYKAEVAHSESIVYEWLGSADHVKFREILGILKQFQGN